MKPLSIAILLGVCSLGAGVGGFSAGCQSEAAPEQTPRSEPRSGADQPAKAAGEVVASDVVIDVAMGRALPPYSFSAEDNALLDEVQHGCFNFFWYAGDPKTGMAPDRASEPRVSSIAGVGFQLSAFPVAVERGWVTRAEAEARTLLILKTLAGNSENRKGGLFYHFLDGATGGQPSKAYEHVVSTIDSALFFCGAITASSYFGGEVARIADGLVADADWSFFVSKGDSYQPYERNFVTLGWKPTSLVAPTGAGKLLPYVWVDAGDEHRLVTFLAVAAPTASHAVDPSMYYRLRRGLGENVPGEPMVWFPWSGALFVQLFAHCWLDYAHLGPDNPAAFEVAQRARVNWWENARRTTQMHRDKAIKNPAGKPTLGEHAWGLSASDIEGGYGVPGVFPRPLMMKGSRPEWDYPVTNTDKIVDNYGDGTIAPYAAGSAIMFEPAAAIAAMRHYRGLKKADGDALLWSDPKMISMGWGKTQIGAGRPGFGFADAYREAEKGGTGLWVAPDYVAIDQGPLILAIENARTGLITKLFHQHPVVKAGVKRLKLGPK